MTEKPTLLQKIIPYCISLTLLVGTLLSISTITYQNVSSKVFPIEIGFALVLFLSALAYSWQQWKHVFRNPLVWGMAFFVLASIMASFTSHDAVISWFGCPDRGTSTMLLIILFLAACAMGVTLSTGKARSYIFNAISVSGAIVAFSVILEQGGVEFFRYAGMGGLLGNSSLAGTYLIFSLFITLYLFFTQHTLWKKILLSVIAFLTVVNPIFIKLRYFGTPGQSFFDLVGEARGATISVAVGLIVTLGILGMTARKKSYRIAGKITLAIVALAIVVGSVLFVTPNTQLRNWFTSEASGTRYIYWDIALKAAHDHPFLGTGPETYGYTYQTYFNPDMMLKKYASEIWSNKPHNAYLEILSTTGAIGFVAYLCLWAGLLVALVRKYRSDRDRYFLGFIGGLLAAYALNNVLLFDSSTSYMLLFSLFGYILATTTVVSPQKDTRSVAVVRYIIGLAIFVIVLWVVIPQITKMTRAYKDFTLPLDQRASWYAHTESASAYGSAIFLAERADFTYSSIYLRSLPLILQQPAENKAITITAINALIAEMKKSFEHHPVNEQGYLAIARLENIKMPILNAADPEAMADMKDAAQKAIEISPRNPQGYWLLGQEYIYEQKYQDAYDTFENARLINPAIAQSHIALINLAQLLHDQKKVAYFADRAKVESADFNTQ